MWNGAARTNAQIGPQAQGNPLMGGQMPQSNFGNMASMFGSPWAGRMQEAAPGGSSGGLMDMFGAQQPAFGGSAQQQAQGQRAAAYQTPSMSQPYTQTSGVSPPPAPPQPTNSGFGPFGPVNQPFTPRATNGMTVQSFNGGGGGVGGFGTLPPGWQAPGGQSVGTPYEPVPQTGGLDPYQPPAQPKPMQTSVASTMGSGQNAAPLTGDAWDVLSQGDFAGPSGRRAIDLARYAQGGYNGGLMVSPITMGSDVTAARQAQMWIEDQNGQRIGGEDNVWGRPTNFNLQNLDPNGKYFVNWANAGPNGIRAQGRGR